jgi:hypothetical protein
VDLGEGMYQDSDENSLRCSVFSLENLMGGC